MIRFYRSVHSLISFFFNDPATTEIYTLSLHDALPICPRRSPALSAHSSSARATSSRGLGAPGRDRKNTSELQSQSNLVCRLLLEKKKQSKDDYRGARRESTRPRREFRAPTRRCPRRST